MAVCGRDGHVRGHGRHRARVVAVEPERGTLRAHAQREDKAGADGRGVGGSAHVHLLPLVGEGVRVVCSRGRLHGQIVVGHSNQPKKKKFFFFNYFLKLAPNYSIPHDALVQWRGNLVAVFVEEAACFGDDGDGHGRQDDVAQRDSVGVDGSLPARAVAVRGGHRPADFDGAVARVSGDGVGRRDARAAVGATARRSHGEC